MPARSFVVQEAADSPRRAAHAGIAGRTLPLLHGKLLRLHQVLVPRCKLLLHPVYDCIFVLECLPGLREVALLGKVHGLINCTLRELLGFRFTFTLFLVELRPVVPKIRFDLSPDGVACFLEELRPVFKPAFTFLSLLPFEVARSKASRSFRSSSLSSKACLEGFVSSMISCGMLSLAGRLSRL